MIKLCVILYTHPLSPATTPTLCVAPCHACRTRPPTTAPSVSFPLPLPVASLGYVADVCCRHGLPCLGDAIARQALPESHAARARHIYSLAFNPAGMLLAAGSERGTVHLWRLGPDRKGAAFFLFIRMECLLTCVRARQGATDTDTVACATMRLWAARGQRGRACAVGCGVRCVCRGEAQWQRRVAGWDEVRDFPCLVVGASGDGSTAVMRCPCALILHIVASALW